MAAFHSFPPNDRPLHSNLHTSSNPPADPTLPNGPCNYRDLNQGRHASSCGCQRFWRVDGILEPNHNIIPRRLAGDASGRAWCFCGHHACFHTVVEGSASQRDGHDDGVGHGFARSPSTVQTSPAIPGQSRPVSSHQEAPHTAHGNDQPRFMTPSCSTANNKPLVESNRVPTPCFAPSPLRKQGPCVSGDRANLTKSGLGLFLDRTQETEKHPMYSNMQRLLAEDVPSTREISPRVPSAPQSVSDGGPRPSPNSHFMDHVAQTRMNRPPVQIPVTRPVTIEDLAQSATEVATPSQAGTPVLDGSDEVMQSIKIGIEGLQQDLVRANQTLNERRSATPAFSTELHGPTDKAFRQVSTAQGHVDIDGAHKQNTTLAELVSQIASLRNVFATSPTLGSSLLSISNRLDVLETTSLPRVSVEDIDDKVELFDGRLLDIESKVDDLEKFNHVHEQDQGGRRPAHDLALASFASHLSEGQDGTLVRVDPLMRLKSLEDRLISLEKAGGPSISQPWEVEIVLLPWSRDLKGIWFPGDEASGGPHMITQDSSNLVPKGKPSRRSTKSSKSKSKIIQEWKPQIQDARSARACGPAKGSKGRLFDRLRSRGFVRKVSIYYDHSDHILSAVYSAFQDLLKASGQRETNDREDSIMSDDDEAAPSEQLMALHCPFIPLRKVHKSTRLQFLSPAEMSTPSLWTANFLDANVFMKAPSQGLTRLYITTPASYLQNAEASTWTWQKIRELPRFERPHDDEDMPDADIQGVGEADACEACWVWDARLDPPTSANSSFASHGSFASSHPLSPEVTEPAPSSKADDQSEPAFDSESEQEGSELDDDVEETEQKRPSSSTAVAPAPITPMSEYPPKRVVTSARRTASFPVGELAASQPQVNRRPQALQPKREVASFDNFLSTTGPQHASPSPPRAAAPPKRRRMSSRMLDVDSSLRAPWNWTPRRSREPRSPSIAVGSASAGVNAPTIAPTRRR